MRNVLPAIKTLFGMSSTKRLASEVGKSAAATGGKFIADVMSGKNAKVSAKAALNKAKRELASDLNAAAVRKRPNARSSKKKKKKKKKKHESSSESENDLFD